MVPLVGVEPTTRRTASKAAGFSNFADRGMKWYGIGELNSCYLIENQVFYH